jgi:CubicO group peptidase (beta-lactamase class C family)
MHAVLNAISVHFAGRLVSIPLLAAALLPGLSAAQQSQDILGEYAGEIGPPGAVSRPPVQEITLLDLAAQRSGLPAMPDSISVANMDNPYADYHTADMLAYRSTAPDMLAFLVANLHPDRIKPRDGYPDGATLAAAIRMSLQPQGQLPDGMGLSFGWLYQAETGNFWHNGATAAYSSYAFFNPKGDYAAVVLLNTSPGVNGSFVEVLGRHISQRLAGKRAVALSH